MGAGKPRIRAGRGGAGGRGGAVVTGRTGFWGSTGFRGSTALRGSPGGRVAVACAGLAGLAVLVSGCGTAAAAPGAAGQVAAAGRVQGTATSTVAPSTVPVLGKLSFGTFPSTWDGTRALALCEQWSGLRGQYVTRIRSQTPYQLEQWFSSAAWRPAFVANTPLRTDPAYSHLDTAFGLVSTAAAASIASARVLDQACGAVD
jgi:hypothetical protein